MKEVNLGDDDGFMAITVPSPEGPVIRMIDVMLVFELLSIEGTKSGNDVTTWKAGLASVLAAQGFPDLSYHKQTELFWAVKNAADELQKKSEWIPRPDAEPALPTIIT